MRKEGNGETPGRGNKTKKNIVLPPEICQILNVLSDGAAQIVIQSRNTAEATDGTQPSSTPTIIPARHANMLSETLHRIMCRSWVAVVFVGVMAALITLNGVAGRDSEYYLTRWIAKSKDKNIVLAPMNTPMQIPSPLMNPWSRLPPGATKKLILTAIGASNTTTQIPDDAQLLPPSLADPPAIFPAFLNSTERDPKRE